MKKTWNWSSNADNSRAGYDDIWLGTALALVIMVIMVFLVIGLGNIRRGAKAWSWETVPCSIEDTKRTTGPGGDTLTVTFAYFFGEKNYTTSRDLHDEPGQLRRFEKFLNMDHRSECLVNPDKPSEAMLAQEYGDFEAFTVIMTCCLVLTPVIGIVLLVLARLRSRTVSLRRQQLSFYFFRWCRLGGAVLAIIFGGISFYFVGILNFYRAWDSRSWDKTTCVIRECRFVETKENGLYDYHLDLKYDYSYQNHPYAGTAYSIWEEDADGEKEIKAVVLAYKVGDEVPCYVNPADPKDAALKNDLTLDLLGGFGPLLILAFGLWYFWVNWREKSPVIETVVEPEEEEEWNDVYSDFYHPVHWQDDEGDVFCKSREYSRSFSGYVWAFLICGGVAAGRALFIYQPENWSWIWDFYFVLFAVLGLLGLGMAVYSAIRTYCLTTELSIEPWVLKMGQPVKVVWHLKHAIRPVTKLRIELVCLEKTLSAHADKDVYIDQVVSTTEVVSCERLGPGDLPAELTVPEGMPTFCGLNSEIVWQIRVRGLMACFPPVREDYSVVVVSPAVPPEDKKDQSAKAVTEEKAFESGPLSLCLPVPVGEGPEADPKPVYELAQHVTGKVKWQELDGEQHLRLRLYWQTTGRAERTTEIVRQLPIKTDEKSGEIEFSIQLPYGPPSYAGELFAIEWFLELDGDGISQSVVVPLQCGSR